MHESLKKNSFKTQKRCLAAGEAVFMVQIMKAWVQNSALCLTVQKWKTIQSFNTKKKKPAKGNTALSNQKWKQEQEDRSW